MPAPVVTVIRYRSLSVAVRWVFSFAEGVNVPSALSPRSVSTSKSGLGSPARPRYHAGMGVEIDIVCDHIGQCIAVPS
jgi:hypothetical protein